MIWVKATYTTTAIVGIARGSYVKAGPVGALWLVDGRTDKAGGKTELLLYPADPHDVPLNVTVSTLPLPVSLP